MRDFFRDLGEFRLVRTIFALWEKISEFGLTPEFHGTVRKREILLNRAMAIAAFYDFVVTTLMMITIGSVAIVKGEYSVLLSILVFGSVFWVVGAAMAGLLWLRHLRIPLFISLDRSNGVEYLGYSLTIIMLLLAGLMLPYKALFFSFAVAVTAVLPVIPKRRSYDNFIKIFLFVCTVGIFFSIVHWHDTRAPLIDMPNWTVPFFSVAMPLGAICLVFLVGSYVASESEKSESALDLERGKNAKRHQESEKLLLNILPAPIAAELKAAGRAEPQLYEKVTVLFTDFVGFTSIAEKLSAKELVGELDRCFSYFDSVAEKYGLEKLKTIGDAYMAAGGIPVVNTTHPFDCALAALEIQSFMGQMREIKTNQNLPYWELRLGMHVGPLVAGVVGEKKFAYDVWGDTVNTASRMESSGEAGAINLSKDLYEEIKFLFDCEYRGRVAAKNKGEIDMYFLLGLKPKYSVSGLGRVPNGDFKDLYARLKSGAKLVAKA